MLRKACDGFEYYTVGKRFLRGTEVRKNHAVFSRNFYEGGTSVFFLTYCRWQIIPLGPQKIMRIFTKWFLRDRSAWPQKYHSIYFCFFFTSIFQFRHISNVNTTFKYCILLLVKQPYLGKLPTQRLPKIKHKKHNFLFW